jgi:hypothetical protein
MAKNSKKKSVLTLKLFQDEDINKNDIIYAVSYLLHKYTITSISQDMIDYLMANYSEYILDILKMVPDDRKHIKEQLFNLFGAISPRAMKELFKIFRNDGTFCKVIIERAEYDKNAAEHGLSA